MDENEARPSASLLRNSSLFPTRSSSSFHLLCSNMRTIASTSPEEIVITFPDSSKIYVNSDVAQGYNRAVQKSDDQGRLHPVRPQIHALTKCQNRLANTFSGAISRLLQLRAQLSAQHLPGAVLGRDIEKYISLRPLVHGRHRLSETQVGQDSQLTGSVQFARRRMPRAASPHFASALANDRDLRYAEVEAKERPQTSRG